MGLNKTMLIFRLKNIIVKLLLDSKQPLKKMATLKTAFNGAAKKKPTKLRIVHVDKN